MNTASLFSVSVYITCLSCIERHNISAKVSVSGTSSSVIRCILIGVHSLQMYGLRKTNIIEYVECNEMSVAGAQV